MESTGQHMTRMCAAEPHAHVGVVSGAEAMQAEGGEESPSSMPSVSPLTLPPGTRVCCLCLRHNYDETTALLVPHTH